MEITIGLSGSGKHSDFRNNGEEAQNEEKLSELAEILMKAEEIKADSALYRAVQAHMGRKEKKFRSIADLREYAGKKDAESMGKDRAGRDSSKRGSGRSDSGRSEFEDEDS